RGRDLRCDPAPRRHEGQQDDRRDQQEQGRADLPGCRLRHRAGVGESDSRARGRDQEAQSQPVTLTDRPPGYGSRMAMEATGKLRVIFDTKQMSERFTKREFVLELVDGKYPQMLLFQLTGDRCGSLDQFQIGDEVRLEFNLRGREWKSPQGD